jgi:hypothetical protein
MSTRFSAGQGQATLLFGSLFREGDRGIYMPACISAPLSTIVIRAMRVYKVWESTGRFIPAGSCAFPAVKSYRCKRSTEWSKHQLAARNANW